MKVGPWDRITALQRQRGINEWKYIGPKRMSLDDHFGARVLYDQKKFRYAGRSYLAIENIPDSIAPNFLTSEFFSRCTDFPDDFPLSWMKHWLRPYRIRDYYNQPVQIISSYQALRMQYGSRWSDIFLNIRTPRVLDPLNLLVDGRERLTMRIQTMC